MTLPGTPLRLDLSPGRKVLHVVTTEKDGVRTEHRYPYEVCGLARCHATGAYRVVCLGAGGLRLFSLDTFERGFVSAEPEAPEPVDSLPIGRSPEPAPVKVAGVFRQGPGW